MPVTEEVKYLKSIDGTLKDILKELKRQGRQEGDTVLKIDSREFARYTAEETDEQINRTKGIRAISAHK